MSAFSPVECIEVDFVIPYFGEHGHFRSWRAVRSRSRFNGCRIGALWVENNDMRLTTLVLNYIGFVGHCIPADSQPAAQNCGVPRRCAWCSDCQANHEFNLTTISQEVRRVVILFFDHHVTDRVPRKVLECSTHLRFGPQAISSLLANHSCSNVVDAR